MALGCFISTGRSIERAIERARLAEALGYDSLFVTHIAGPESLTMLTAYALATERIRLGSGVVPIYTRTPATMAQTAATIDELSASRFTLGLGVSHRAVVESWHGQTIDSLVSEMREYVEIVRAILRDEESPVGEKWRTTFRLAGIEPRPRLPIFVAALSPAMLRLAGEIGDGVILWLCNPHYIRDVVVPEVRKGRERAERSLHGFEIAAAVPAALADDVSAAHDAMRSELITYFGLPFYRAMLERSGFGADIAAYDAAGGEFEGMRAAISNRFLQSLTAIGDEGRLQAAIHRYRHAGVTMPCIGPIAGSNFEATLRAAAAAG